METIKTDWENNIQSKMKNSIDRDIWRNVRRGRVRYDILFNIGVEIKTSIDTNTRVRIQRAFRDNLRPK